MPESTNPLSSFVVPNSAPTHYTPTTAEIRDYVEVGGEARPWADPDDPKDALRAEAFDRWLTAHDSSVRAAALDEAADIATDEALNAPGRTSYTEGYEDAAFNAASAIRALKEEKK